MRCKIASTLSKKRLPTRTCSLLSIRTISETSTGNTSIMSMNSLAESSTRPISSSILCITMSYTMIGGNCPRLVWQQWACTFLIIMRIWLRLTTMPRRCKRLSVKLQVTHTTQSLLNAGKSCSTCNVIQFSQPKTRRTP